MILLYEKFAIELMRAGWRVGRSCSSHTAVRGRREKNGKNETRERVNC